MRQGPGEPAGLTGLSAHAVDPTAMAILERLWWSGEAAYVVGGAVRDTLLGRPGHDWDVTTSALPGQVQELFPDGHPEGRFGMTVVAGVEVTTFRRDHRYEDHRRPGAVSFTTSIDEDLARRDFTVNAIAWGREARAASPALHDPTGGLADLAAGVLRAVGDPDTRFDEDALRLLRAARFASVVGLDIEPATLAAMERHADDVRYLSPERVLVEVRRLLAAPHPSVGLRILEQTRMLSRLLPELARQRGVPQAKVEGHDLWDHTLATVDAAAELAPADERLAFAALLHDVGKPSTFIGGHFIGHDIAGAALAAAILAGLRLPIREAAHVERLVREHMFQYRSDWSDAAVRRFIRRVGPELIDDLLLLREADNLGSGQVADAGELPELRRRIALQLAAGVPMTLDALAIDGDDVMAALGRGPGPWLGETLRRLLESVVNEPDRNTPERLLADVRAWGMETDTA